MQQKVLVNCATGSVAVVPLSAAELTTYQAEQAENAAEQAEDAADSAQRSADVATVQAAALTDPVMAAVARLLGIA